MQGMKKTCAFLVGLNLSLPAAYADMGTGVADYCPKHSEVRELFKDDECFQQHLRQNSFKINGDWIRILTNDSERAKLMNLDCSKAQIRGVTNHEQVSVGVAKSLGLNNGTCLYLVDDGRQQVYLNLQRKQNHK